MKHIMKTGLALVAILALGVVACDEDGTDVGADDATVRVLLTDAPADYISAARVDIGAVELIPNAPADGEVEDPESITLADDATEGFVNLLDLQGEATALLAENPAVETGTYAQLRVKVDSAEVALMDGYEFNSGGTEKTLFVASGAQTGIKLNLHNADGADDGQGVEVVPGENVLVLDFDVNQSFVIQGNPSTPAGIEGVLFTPAVRVTVEDVAGSIAGTVGAADSVDVEDLEVTATPTGESNLEEYQTETATAQTDSAGMYSLNYLVPGGYSVSVAADSGFQSVPDEIPVTVNNDQDVTNIDFTIDEDAP